jgi:hypothetical protein
MLWQWAMELHNSFSYGSKHIFEGCSRLHFTCKYIGKDNLANYLIWFGRKYILLLWTASRGLVHGFRYWETTGKKWYS